jgi:hypothetical protein
VVLRFRLLSYAPLIFTIEFPTKTSRVSFPQVHGGGRVTNAVHTASQDSHLTWYNYNGSCKSQGVLWVFSKLTQLTRGHLEQARSDLTNLSTSQSAYTNHRVILLSTWVYEYLEMSITCIGMLLGLPHLQMTGWVKYI